LSKYKLHLFGWITLLVFPIPAFWCLWYFEKTELLNFLQIDQLWNIRTALGIEFGIGYAFLALIFMNAPVFDEIPDRIEKVIQGMNLNWFDILFLSFCAGAGEELLFRVGVQHYLGIWITSVLFVAIHGYLNPFNWRKSLYGLIVLPFIVLISYGYNHFGLWFCIGAHFSYDLVLFYAIVNSKD
jgi:hypothetical protein